MIRLKKLELAGFRSFKDTTSVTFPESGLTLIQGLNQDTGDSSGSGKSSLVLGLQYLLGGCPFSGTDLRTWGSDTSPYVKALFDTPKGPLEVERSKGLSVRLNGQKIGGSAALAEKELCQIFGMDAATRSVVTYRGQKKPGFFLSMSDSEKKEFLSGILGLSKFEEEAEKALAKAKQYESQKIICDDRLATAVKQAQDWQDSMGMNPDNPEQVEFLKLKKAQIEQEIEALEKLHTEKYSWVNSKNREFSDALNRELDLLRAERQSLLKKQITPQIAEIEEKISKCVKKIEIGRTCEAKVQADYATGLSEMRHRVRYLKQEVERIPLLTKRKEQIEQHLKVLQRDTCPTCLREWADGKNSKTQKDLLLELKTVNAELADLLFYIPQIENLEKEIAAAAPPPSNPVLVKLILMHDELQATKNSLVAENQAAIRHAIQELDNKEKEIRLRSSCELEAALVQAQTELELAKNGKAELSKKRIQLDQEIFTIEAGTRNWKKQEQILIQKQNAVSAAEKDLQKVDFSTRLELDLAHLLGHEGFLGAIFEEILADISHTANSIMQRISNVQHVSIRFASEKETKSGKVYKRITPIVSVGGVEVKAEAGLSGGMYTAVELAVDLAVGDVVSKRKGIYPGWLILDESFDGLGKTSKESCIEMLTEYAKDRLVLIIDHATELQSRFSQTIKVKLLDGKSTIVHD